MRLTVRRMVAVVAVIAIGLGLETTRRRWVICSERATRYKNFEGKYRQEERNCVLMARIYEDLPLTHKAMAERNRELDFEGLNHAYLGFDPDIMNRMTKFAIAETITDMYKYAEKHRNLAEICSRSKLEY